MDTYTSTVIHDGLSFGEGPRWHDGRLFFSDFYRQGVFSVNADGSNEQLVVHVENQPSGLGWLPDGSLLVVSMIDRTIQKFDGTSLREHASLNPHATFWANDMVVSDTGVAYVGNFGFDLDQYSHDRDAGLEQSVHFSTAALVVVDPSGAIIQVVPDLAFPNGMVITDNGTTLVVAESFAARLSAFDISSDGTLSNQRVWADLGGHPPDGICLDPNGQIWVSAIEPLTLRVKEGGDITAQVTSSQRSYACALGGADLSTLFVMTARDSSRFDVAQTRDGCIESAAITHGS